MDSEAEHKKKEDDLSQSNTELSKLNALIEQKVDMIEKELIDYKSKYTAKDTDYKEANKELNKTRKELQQISNKIHQLETSHAKELEKMRTQYDQKVKKIEEERSTQSITTSPGNVSSNIDSNYKMLSDQMNMMVQQFQRMSTVNQNPFASPPPNAPTSYISQQDYDKQKDKVEKQKQKNRELLQTNTNLSAQIVLINEKSQQLEKTLATYKKYKWMLHHAAGIQCLQCGQLFTRELFSNHLPDCRNQVVRISTINANRTILPIKISIVDFIEHTQ